MIGATIRRHPRLSVLAALLLLGAASVPVVAYVVVPAFVKSTLVEDLPAASAAPSPSAGASASAAGVTTLASGQLVKISLADYGSGTVRLVQVGPDRFVRFEDVDIAGAPDMYVYLSDRADGKPGTFVDLGKLKATNGSFNYPVAASVDLSAVRSVVIWCRQFTVTVTYAVLAKP